MRTRTLDPLIKSPNNHTVYQQHKRKPSHLGTLDFICQLSLLQTKNAPAKRPLHSREVTKERTTARWRATEYFERFPKDRYQRRWRAGANSNRRISNST